MYAVDTIEVEYTAQGRRAYLLITTFPRLPVFGDSHPFFLHEKQISRQGEGMLCER